MFFLNVAAPGKRRLLKPLVQYFFNGPGDNFALFKVIEPPLPSSLFNILGPQISPGAQSVDARRNLIGTPPHLIIRRRRIDMTSTTTILILFSFSHNDMIIYITIHSVCVCVCVSLSFFSNFFQVDPCFEKRNWKTPTTPLIYCSCW